MDLVTLALAKAYTDKQRLAHTEKKVFTFDGNTSDKDLLPGENGGAYVKMTDEVIDMATVKSVYFSLAGVGFEEDGFGKFFEAQDNMIIVTDNSVLNPDDAYDVFAYLEIGTLIAVTVAETVEEDGLTLEKGTYVYCGPVRENLGDATLYISRIETETIHPIEPKFIPGVVLPVVEIDKEGLLTEPSALSEAEAETIEKIVNAGSKYILASVSVGGFPVATTILRKAIAEEEIAFVGLAGTGSVMIAKENGQWAIVVE